MECDEQDEDNGSNCSMSDHSDAFDVSIEDSFQFANESTRDFFEEMPTFSIKCLSPCGRSPSPIGSEPISLLNLSISPIGSNYDLSEFTDDDTRTSHADLFRSSERSGQDISGTDDEERVSLDDITAQINTPPPASTRGSSKRLNLETIFEGVFLETPPKRRKFESWQMRTIREVTVERINTYVKEQQQKAEKQQSRSSGDSSEYLCHLFEEHIDLQ